MKRQCFYFQLRFELGGTLVERGKRRFNVAAARQLSLRLQRYEEAGGELRWQEERLWAQLTAKIEAADPA